MWPALYFRYSSPKFSANVPKFSKMWLISPEWLCTNKLKLVLFNVSWKSTFKTYFCTSLFILTSKKKKSEKICNYWKYLAFIACIMQSKYVFVSLLRESVHRLHIDINLKKVCVLRCLKCIQMHKKLDSWIFGMTATFSLYIYYVLQGK